MAIFVALIFQVLFVFFAMVINVSMIVHDKIVLQNSVDFAAYYAAQKQAEVLNQMAHINYQIRQANKLLAWRQWVLGDLGYDSHPLRVGSTPPPLLDQLDSSLISPATGEPEPPGICITHSDWQGTVSTSPGSTLATNMCGKRSLNVPPIPIFTAPSIPLIGDIFDRLEELTEKMALAAATNCQSLGPVNWLFAAKVQAAYRMDLSIRKRMMMELANQLSADASDFRDIRGDSVLGGVEKVVQKNVNQNHEPPTVEMMNSLALGSCGAGGFVEDIVVNPLVNYADFTTLGGGCRLETKPVVCSTPDCIPRHATAAHGFPGPAADVYSYLQARPMDLPEEQRPSLGYEKNPWCMAYVGVRATMQSRKPFGPFGEPVELVATGYAKPFGGTLGPWYNTEWGPGADHSHGLQKVDELAPTRDLPGVSVSHGSKPNYSRYPGDKLGYMSVMERGALREIFLGPTNFGYGGILLRRKFYEHIDQMSYLERTGNSLADSLTDAATTSPSFRLRQIEMAAVAPDLFDVTYYSVEPDYYKNYLKEQLEHSLFDRVRPISDLGSHLELPDFREANVGLQIVMTSRNPTGASTPYNADVFYKIRNQAHLLTGWLPRGLVDYGAPGADFMSCDAVVTGEVPQPGMCYAGGRVGHSVKLVHKDYLMSPQHQLGGEDAARGELRNPPSAAGW